MTISDEHIEELVESMRTMGQLVPLIVTPDAIGAHALAHSDVLATVEEFTRNGGMFEIIDGHCRYLAAELVPLTELQCSVFLDVAEAKHAMMLHAGIIRQSFTAFEEGAQFVQLSEKHGWSLEDLCKTFHRSEAYINDRVSLATADPRISTAVHQRTLNLSQAKQLMRVKDETCLGYMLEQATVHGATARTLEVMRHNWNIQQVAGETGTKPHTPANSQEQDPVAQPVCIWCGEGADQENIVMLPVHWYHKREVSIICDKVGSKTLLAAKPAEPAVSRES